MSIQREREKNSSDSTPPHDLKRLDLLRYTILLAREKRRTTQTLAPFSPLLCTCVHAYKKRCMHVQRRGEKGELSKRHEVCSFSELPSTSRLKCLSDEGPEGGYTQGNGSLRFLISFFLFSFSLFFSCFP